MHLDNGNRLIKQIIRSKATMKTEAGNKQIHTRKTDDEESKV